MPSILLRRQHSRLSINRVLWPDASQRQGERRADNLRTALSQPSSGTLCSHSPAVDLGLDGLWTSAAGFSSSGKGTGGIQSDKQNEMRHAK